jgi:hypothetical protein
MTKTKISDVLQGEKICLRGCLHLTLAFLNLDPKGCVPESLALLGPKVLGKASKDPYRTFGSYKAHGQAKLKVLSKLNTDSIF